MLLNDPLIFSLVVTSVAFIPIICLTLWDTPKEQGWMPWKWSIASKYRFRGLLLVIIGVGFSTLIKVYFSSAEKINPLPWEAEFFPNLLTTFSAAIAAVYIGKGYSVRPLEGDSVFSQVIQNPAMSSTSCSIEINSQPESEHKISAHISINGIEGNGNGSNHDCKKLNCERKYMTKKPAMLLLGVAFLALGNGGVLAEQECDPNTPETTPASRFTVNEQEGTAFDTQTKLTWKLCVEGRNFQDGNCMGVGKTIFWPEAVETFGANDEEWRLPNKDELMSIVEKRCARPSLNKLVFPGASKSYGILLVSSSEGLKLWTTSTVVSKAAYAWVVDFARGEADEEHKTKSYTHPVRLVRGKKWFDPAGNLEQQDAIANLEYSEYKQKEIEIKRKDAERNLRDKLEKEARERESIREKQQLGQRAVAFRKGIKTGDESNCGLVIEVKQPIAKIQTASGERWFKVEQLYPQGVQTCGLDAGDARIASPKSNSNRLVGTRVCRVFTGATNQSTGLGFCGPVCTVGFSSCSGRIAVSGVVEKIAGEKIQIRISNSHVAERPECYAPIQTGEGSTERNSILWDMATNWTGC